MKSGKFATDVVTVFHAIGVDSFGAPTETERFLLENVMVVATDAQGDSVIGNSAPQNSARLFYYPGRSTVNGCYVKNPNVLIDDTLIVGNWESLDAVNEAGAVILKVKSVSNYAHIQRVTHTEVLCG